MCVCRQMYMKFIHHIGVVGGAKAVGLAERETCTPTPLYDSNGRNRGIRSKRNSTGFDGGRRKCIRSKRNSTGFDGGRRKCRRSGPANAE